MVIDYYLKDAPCSRPYGRQIIQTPTIEYAHDLVSQYDRVFLHVENDLELKGYVDQRLNQYHLISRSHLQSHQNNAVCLLYKS